jgi:Transcriptional regulator
MYRPAAFAVDDRSALDAFVDAQPFALIASAGAEGSAPVVTHAPVLREQDVLVCHLARPNPHCARLAAGAATTVVFSGPHGYVSPRWYAAPHAVPTWNYTAVHCTVAPCEIEDAGELRAGMEAMVARFEPAPGIEDVVTPATVDGMLRGIRGFRMTIRRCEGVFKLSQNRSGADRAGVVARLEALGGDQAALAALMRAGS